MKRIFICFLSFVLSLFSFTSCIQIEKNPADTSLQVKKYAYTEGVHDFSSIERADYLVRNGVTEYSLLLPEVCDTFLDFAVDEFSTLFKRATGVEIKVIRENKEGIAHTAEGKYISLGETKMLESSGVAIDYAELGTQGVRIITKDNSVYLVGGSTQGVLYAVYDFMQMVFDYEIYAEDCIVINENVKDVKMRDFNVTDVPDIEMRCKSFSARYDEEFARRFRRPYSHSEYMIPLGDISIGATPATIHNSDDILPAFYWKDSHPRWFADTGEQLCYTAHGDSDEYEKMISQIAKVIVDCLRRYPVDEFPQYNLMTLTMEDDHSSCTCDACKNAKNLYGEESGAVIVVCNKVMEKVQTEMQKEENKQYYRENLKLLFFAYNNFIYPPAIYDATTKTYEPMHDDLKLRDDVGVFFAISKDINSMASIYHETNDSIRENCLKWYALADNLYLWTYTTNFSGYMAMCDTTSHYTSEGYQFFVQGGAKMFFNQANGSQESDCNFDGLKSYLDYKLQWDCTLDESVLTDEWFNAVYGATAGLMRELYEAKRAYNFLLYDINGKLDQYSMYVTAVYQSKNWSYSVLDSWLKKCEEAIAYAQSIYAATDIEKYESIKYHIDCEWIGPAYLMVTLFERDYIPLERWDGILDYFAELEQSEKFGKLVESEQTRANTIWSEINELR